VTLVPPLVGSRTHPLSAMLARTRPATRGTFGVTTDVETKRIVPVAFPATFSTSDRSRVLRRQRVSGEQGGGGVKHFVRRTSDSLHAPANGRRQHRCSCPADIVLTCRSETPCRTGSLPSFPPTSHPAVSTCIHPDIQLSTNLVPATRMPRQLLYTTLQYLSRTHHSSQSFLVPTTPKTAAGENPLISCSPLKTGAQ
jgi:hypothetical protein